LDGFRLWNLKLTSWPLSDKICFEFTCDCSPAIQVRMIFRVRKHAVHIFQCLSIGLRRLLLTEPLELSELGIPQISSRSLEYSSDFGR